MEKKNLTLLIAGVLVAIMGLSCSQFNFDLPRGPQGDDGASAYEIWKVQVLNGSIEGWSKDKIDFNDYLRFRKGEKGADGLSIYELWKTHISKGDVVNPHDKNEKWDPKKNTQEDFWNFMIGRGSQAPYIGDNKHWFIDGKDTGLSAVGANGLSAYELWKNDVDAGKITNPDGTLWSTESTTMSDFFRYLKGQDGKNGENGIDGQIPRIGEDGYWYIGETNTGVKAKGDKGDSGENSGSGLSAYELWKNDVAAGTIQDKNGEAWSKDKNSQSDFYKYLKGDKGDNGDKGADGLSSYELWKDLISGGDVINPHDKEKKWDSKKNTPADFWNFMIGRDAQIPYIGENNHWFIGGKDTGVPAIGTNGLSAYTQWKKSVQDGEIFGSDGTLWPTESTEMSDFFRYLKGQDGKNGENGIDGQIPHISEDGYWYIGEANTGVKAKGDKGDKGDNGDNGLSAYELWKNDVAAGSIQDKDGQDWPTDKNSQSDFYKYLQGKDGKDGKDGNDSKSAYERWKELAETGDLDNPKAGVEENDSKWPSDKTTLADFYNYLTGKDGKSVGDKGPAGSSAYDLWKKELADKCGTPDALVNYNTGAKWPCERNSIDDFFDYLRGLTPGDDGTITDGNDGRPGELGKPSMATTIKRGFRNVIAQYAYAEFSEYVRTTDGGVEYIVYDEFGSVAPGATVQGMPGIDPSKVYTADERGHFIVPREDLPRIEDVNSRWGRTASVTIPGKGAKASAKNTYVPNRIDVRLEFFQGPTTPPEYAQGPELDDGIDMWVKIVRQTDPDGKWKAYPHYLPRYGLSFSCPVVADKNDPKSRKGNNMVVRQVRPDSNQPLPINFDSNSGTSYSFVSVWRPMLNKFYTFDNSQTLVVPPTERYYFTVVSNETLYGQYLEWNGTAELVPYQDMPYIKSLNLKGKHVEKQVNGKSVVYFDRVEGEFEFSHIDFSRIYKRFLVKEPSSTPDAEVYSGNLYTEAEAKALRVTFVDFEAKSPSGKQIATSQRVKSSFDVPTFEAERVYLDSRVDVRVNLRNHDDYTHIFRDRRGVYLPQGGKLQEVGSNTNKYIIKWGKKYVPNCTVTYENN